MVYRQHAITLHDNVISHTAQLTEQWFQPYSWEVLLKPTRCPHLELTDFHLFWPFKHNSLGRGL